MSIETVTGIPFAPGGDGLYALVVAQVRTPSSVVYDAPTDTTTYTFTPDLTAAEAQTFDDCVSTFRQHAVTWTFAEFEAIRPKLVEVRSFRQRTMAQWNALSATQRESDEISYLNDLTDILRALLRS